ncbi:MAG: hypothetical protein FWF05_05640 [Oscillospiraceae bacterium]|nr:hypothetical protein [Oscillospiraceae bacterium]
MPLYNFSAKRVVKALVILVAVTAAAVFINEYQALEYYAVPDEIAELKAKIDLPRDFMIIASPGCMGQNADSERAVEEGIKNGADCLEINVAFRVDGTPVLAKSDLYVTDRSYPLEEVIKKIYRKRDTRLMINLNEFSDLEALYTLLSDYGMLRRMFIANVNKDTSLYVARRYPGLELVYDADANADLSSEAVCARIIAAAFENGASGIRCRVGQITDEFQTLLRERTPLKLYITGADSEYEQYLALSRSPDGIQTKNPRALRKIRDQDLSSDS